MFEDQLIEAIKKHKCIYNKKHKFYYDRVEKNKAWVEIAKEVCQPARVCHNRWKSLRDRYVRDIAKNDGVPPDTELNAQMSFLREFVGPRSRSHPKTGLLDSLMTEVDDQSQSQSCFPTIFTEVGNPLHSDGEQTMDNFDAQILEEPVIIANPKMEDNTTQQITFLSSKASTPATSANNNRWRKTKKDTADDKYCPCCLARNTEEINELKQQLVDRKSRNYDFLKVLDSYLLKMDEDQQDALKIELLNVVHNRQLVIADCDNV